MKNLLLVLRSLSTDNVKQRQFFEFAGPLFSVAVSPASSVVRVGEQRSLRALPYDRSRRRVETDLTFIWEVVEGEGTLDRRHDQAVSFLAPTEPGLVRVRVSVRQGDIERSGDATNNGDARITSPGWNDNGRIVGVAGLHFRKFAGRFVAIQIRFDAEHNCRKQWSPRFRVRRPQQVAQASLPGPTVFQGARAQELRRLATRPTPGAHGRVIAKNRGEPLTLLSSAGTPALLQRVQR